MIPDWSKLASPRDFHNALKAVTSVEDGRAVLGKMSKPQLRDLAQHLGKPVPSSATAARLRQQLEAATFGPRLAKGPVPGRDDAVAHLVVVGIPKATADWAVNYATEFYQPASFDQDMVERARDLAENHAPDDLGPAEDVRPAGEPVVSAVPGAVADHRQQRAGKPTSVDRLNDRLQQAGTRDEAAKILRGATGPQLEALADVNYLEPSTNKTTLTNRLLADRFPPERPAEPVVEADPAAVLDYRLQQAATYAAAEEVLRSANLRQIHGLAARRGLDLTRRRFRDDLAAELMQQRFPSEAEVLDAAAAAAFLVEEMNVPAAPATRHVQAEVARERIAEQAGQEPTPMTRAGLRDAARQMPTTVPGPDSRRYQAPPGAAQRSEQDVVEALMQRGVSRAAAEWAAGWCSEYWQPDVFDDVMLAAAERQARSYDRRAANATGGAGEPKTGDLTVPDVLARVTATRSELESAYGRWGLAIERVTALAQEITGTSWTTAEITTAYAALADKLGTKDALDVTAAQWDEGLSQARAALQQVSVTVGEQVAAVQATGNAEAYR